MGFPLRDDITFLVTYPVFGGKQWMTFCGHLFLCGLQYHLTARFWSVPRPLVTTNWESSYYLSYLSSPEVISTDIIYLNWVHSIGCGHSKLGHFSAWHNLPWLRPITVHLVEIKRGQLMWDELYERSRTWFVCNYSGRHSVGVGSDAGWTFQGGLGRRSCWPCGVPACTLALGLARRCYRHRQVTSHTARCTDTNV